MWGPRSLQARCEAKNVSTTEVLPKLNRGAVSTHGLFVMSLALLCRTGAGRSLGNVMTLDRTERFSKQMHM
mgnify:CR=1 FL=1